MTWMKALSQRHLNCFKKGQDKGMPPTLCHEKHFLARELANKAGRVASVGRQMIDLIDDHKKNPQHQNVLDLESLRLELDMYLKDWKRTNDDLHQHKAKHGC